MAVERVDLPAFRERQTAGAHARPLSRHRLFDVLRAHRLRHAGLRGARHGDHAGLGDRRASRMDPSGFVEARIGASPHGQGLRTTLAQIIADEIGVDAGSDQGHARRHRPHALRLRHLRQPLAGDLRRRQPAGGAQGARQADQDRRPPAGSRARGHRAATPAPRRVTGTDRVDPDRAAGARRLSPGASASRARSSRACREQATYDPPGTFSNACHVAIVEVDIETGGVTIETLRGRRGCRPPHQSDDRRRPDPRRRRAGHRQRAAGGDHLRRDRQHPDHDARRLPAADLRARFRRSSCITSRR